MRLTNVFILLISSTLTACAVKDVTPANPVLLPETKQVRIPESTLKKCEPISHLESKKYFEKDLVDFVSTVIKQSEVCRANHSLLSDTVRNAFNLPAARTSK